MADRGRRLAGIVDRLLAERRRDLEGLARGLRGPRDLLALAVQRFDDVGERLGRALLGLVNARRAALLELAAMLRPRLLEREVMRQGAGLEGLAERLKRAVDAMLQNVERRLEAEAKLLESLSYRNVLMRGYAVVRETGGRPLTAVAQARPGLAVDIEFHDGKAPATIGDGPVSPSKPRRRRKGGAAEGQGDLF